MYNTIRLDSADHLVTIISASLAHVALDLLTHELYSPLRLFVNAFNKKTVMSLISH